MHALQAEHHNSPSTQSAKNLSEARTEAQASAVEFERQLDCTSASPRYFSSELSYTPALVAQHHKSAKRAEDATARMQALEQRKLSLQTDIKSIPRDDDRRHALERQLAQIDAQLEDARSQTERRADDASQLARRREILLSTGLLLSPLMHKPWQNESASYTSRKRHVGRLSLRARICDTRNSDTAPLRLRQTSRHCTRPKHLLQRPRRRTAKAKTWKTRQQERVVRSSSRVLLLSRADSRVVDMRSELEAARVKLAYAKETERKRKQEMDGTHRSDRVGHSNATRALEEATRRRIKAQAEFGLLVLETGCVGA